MQQPTIQAGLPLSNSQRVPGKMGHRLVSFFLPILILAFVIGSLAWLQWASQRSLKLGYPTPQVTITAGGSSSLVRMTSTNFSASSSGRDVTCTWDFGDGTQAFGNTVSHIYKTTGTFTVVASITDAIGQTSYDQKQVTVLPIAPTASFTYSEPTSNQLINFDASASTVDPIAGPASYSWDFGDESNNPYSSLDPYGRAQESHQYSSSGTYQVILVVTDTTGQNSRFTQSITVS